MYRFILINIFNCKFLTNLPHYLLHWHHHLHLHFHLLHHLLLHYHLLHNHLCQICCVYNKIFKNLYFNIYKILKNINELNKWNMYIFLNYIPIKTSKTGNKAKNFLSIIIQVCHFIVKKIKIFQILKLLLQKNY